MPYVPIKDGPTIWVEDPEEARKKFEESWKVESPSTEEVLSEVDWKPGTMPKTERQVEQSREWVKKKEAEVPWLLGPIERLPLNVPRKLVNDAVSFAQKTAVQSATPYKSSPGSKGMPDLGSPENQGEEFEERKAKIELAQEALEKTGLRPDFSHYGIDKDVPILGEVFSEEGAVAEAVKPLTPGGELVHSIGTVMLADALTAYITGGYSLTRHIPKLRQAPKFAGFRSFWKHKGKAKAWKNGIRSGAYMLLETLIPNAAQDLVYFQPDENPNLKVAIEAARNLPQEERELAMKVLLAKTDDEYSYAWEQFKEVSIGAGSVVALKTVFRAANKILKASKNAVKDGRVQEVTEQAIDEVTPEAQKGMETEALTKASEIREEAIGSATTELYKSIDDTSRKIALSAREITESFVNKDIPDGDEIFKLREELDQALAKAEELGTDSRINQLLKETGLYSESQRATKRAFLEKRRIEFDQYIKDDPQIREGRKTLKAGWLGKRTRGAKGELNVKKSRRIDTALAKLNELEELLAQKQQAIGNVGAKEARYAELVKAAAQVYGEGTAGFQERVIEARRLLNETDKIWNNRAGLLNNKNEQLVYEGRLEEAVEINLIDEVGKAYDDLRALIEEAEKTDIGQNPEFIEVFTERAEKIHDRILTNGGTAPVVAEGLSDVAEEAAPKLELQQLIQDPSTEEGLEVIKKALEEGEERSIAQVAESAASYYGVDPAKALSDFRTKPLDQVIEEYEAIKKAADDDVVGPRTPSVQNETPIKPDGEGKPRVDTDTINGNRAYSNPPPLRPTKGSVATRTEQLNKDNQQFMVPETNAELTEAATNLADRVEEATKLAALDDKNGTNLLADVSDWYNTKTYKYVEGDDVVGLLNEAVRILGERGFNIGRHALVDAVEKLTVAANNPQYLDVLIQEGAEYAQGVKGGLMHIIVQTSMLQNNSMQLLKAARDLKAFEDVGTGELPGLGGGWSRDTLLKNFKDRYKRLMANVKVTSALFEGFGNGLRLMARKNRLKFVEGQPEETLKALEALANSWGDTTKFAEEVQTTLRKAESDIDKKFIEFFELVESGEKISDEQWDGINNLVQKVYDAQGDLLKLKELEVTGSTIIRKIQSGGMISNPATIASIPLQGVPSGIAKEATYAASGYLNAGVARFITRNLDGYEEAIKKARLHQETLLNLRFTFGEALDQSFKSFLYGKGIADPGQSSRAWELQNSAGLLREDQITEDLAANKIKLPFIDYVLNKNDDEQDLIFDTLNKARVFTKVFHDYAFGNELWGKRSFFSKWLLAPSVSASRKLGLGKKSYYANGEAVNLTLPFRLSAVGDEFSSAWFGNARARTLAEIKVDEDIAGGVVDAADRADQLKLYLDKANKDLYAPVTAGLNNQPIGYTVLDEQIKEMTRAINLTEELEGPFKAVGDGINYWRYSDNTYISAFANTLAGVVTSPLNGIKWGIRWGLGIDMYHAAGDAAITGVKSLAEQLPEELQKRVTQNTVFGRNLKEFESKYFSSDLNVRVKAQGALAIATGMHTLAFFQMRDPNAEITGGLENTYRQEQGQVGLFTQKIATPWGDWRMPYRWIPIYGNVLAMQATFRDIEEFGMTKGGNIFGAVAAATANYIMETPGLASVERILKAVTAAGQGDTTKLTKFASQAFAGSGEPYLQFRKFVTEGFDPAKPADPIGKYDVKTFWEENPEYEGYLSLNATGAAMLNSATDTLGGFMGFSHEYTAFGFMTDEIISIVKGHPEGRSRRALYYGQPGETINASHAGKWYPIQAALGRFWPFPDKLDDEVKEEMVNNLIQPPRQDLYKADGIRGINKTVLNDFNHFLNSEFKYYDPITGVVHVGMYSVLKDLVNSKFYQSLPSVDSPYATGGYRILPGLPKPPGATPPNWDRSKNERRTYLSNYVRTLIQKAKEDFMLGDYPGQRYKAPEDLKQAILENRRGNLGGSN